MTLSIAIQEQPNGVALPDLTPRLTRAVFSTNLHGDEVCQLSAPLSLANAFQRYDRPGLPHAIVGDGAAKAFQGRVEDVAIRGDGIDMSAYGYSRALGDAPYTALWSTTKVGEFRPILTTEVSTAFPDRYAFDTNNRLYITAQKGATFGNTTVFKTGLLGYLAPDDGSRLIIGAQFEYEYLLPAANWRVVFQTRDASFALISNAFLFQAAGATGVVRGSKFLTFAGAAIINSFLDFNAADAVFAGETGTCYFKITNLRLVTTTTNKVDTTITVPQLAGPNITATVGSTANMYVGQRLHIGIPAALGEAVIVEQILGPTQFVADFTAAAAAGVNVQAHVVYANEIVEDLIDTVSTLNNTQLLPDVTQVQLPGLDLFDEVYEDQLPSTVLDRLIAMGDNQTPPRRWEWGVTGERRLYFRPDGSAAQTWYVDASALDVQRTLEQLADSAYAVYQNASNRTLRGPIETDETSVARFGVTRRQAVKAQTTSLIQANIERDATLSEKADPAPRFGLTFEAIYNTFGGRVPIWMPRAGDTIVIRNLPPTISANIDQLRRFRIARTSCDLIARTLTVEPAVPLPTMAALIARGLRGQTT